MLPHLPGESDGILALKDQKRLEKGAGVDYKEKSYGTILVDFEEGVLRITNNLPEQRNPLTVEWMAEFRSVLNQAAVDPEVRVLVITGAGQAFSAGGNIREYAREPGERTEAHPLNRPLWNIPTMSAEERLQKQPMSGKEIISELADFPKPTIAAINGTASGAGFDLSLACDLRYVADNAQLIASAVRIGLIPTDGSLWFLSRIVGMTRAYEILYTGNPVSGMDAERIGLANKVLPPDELVPYTMTIAKKLANGPTIAYQLMKHLMRQSLFMDLPEALEKYYSTQEILFNSSDHKEAVKAFLERRDANLKGV